MKYVAEQNRKFTDMGGVKTYHTIYPVLRRSEEPEWGPVIRFDNKVILPGRQEIQSFIGLPLQIIRIAINGMTDYYDSWGYRTVLSEKDTLLVCTGEEVMQTVLHNTDESTENELLEIWLTDNRKDRDYHYHSGPVSREKNKFYTLISNTDASEKATFFNLQAGSFLAGSKLYLDARLPNRSLALFVFSGELQANQQLMNYRDVCLFSSKESIALNFLQDTELFSMEITYEEVKL